MVTTVRSVREEAIAQLVMSRLAEDTRTNGQMIGVLVENGDVLLVGTCDTAEQKAAALTIALGVCGVRRVIDNVRVRPLRQAI